jgi:DNA primase
VNFLLPHIRRLPHAIVRDEFAQDAAQKLDIDSALLRQELKQAATKRSGQMQVRTEWNLSECERVLLRALSGPREDDTFRRAAAALAEQAEHFEGLSVSAALEALCARESPDPLEALREPAMRAMVAQLMMREGRPVSGHELDSALLTLEQHFLERRQRQVRAAIAEAERRADLTAVTALVTERMELDTRLRSLAQRHHALVTNL